MNEHSLLKYFKYDHLTKELQSVSKPFSDMADRLDATLPQGSEKTVAIRKLLEAKDAAVRSYAIDGAANGA